MKIRQGYVSNSSSSSFLVIGRQISFSQIKSLKNIWVEGKQLNDGVDFFQLKDKNMLEKIKTKDLSQFRFYQCSYCGQVLEQSKEIKAKKGDKIYSFERDYHCTIDEYDLYYRYEQKEEEYKCLDETYQVQFFGKQIKQEQVNALFDKASFEKFMKQNECLFLFIEKEDGEYLIKIDKLSDLYLCIKRSENKAYYIVKTSNLDEYVFKKNQEFDSGYSLFFRYYKIQEKQ